MALFGRKKNSEEEKPHTPVRISDVRKTTKQSFTAPSKAKKEIVPASQPKAVRSAKGTYAAVLRSPRITEKASSANEKGVYVFIVAPEATKRDIKRAVQEVYGVVPRKIGITKIHAKVIFNRRIRGVKPGGKKAYVYLKQGDKIEIV